MPKYTYHCSNCNASYTISHRLSEIHDICKSCGTEKTLNKIPVSFAYSKEIKKDSKVGSLVKEVIEDSKRDIAEAKEELKNRKHDKS